MDSPATTAPASPSWTEISDDQAISEVLRGNREMFEVLVRRHNQLLYRIGVGFLRRHEAVEDAMQNSYLKAFLNLGRFHRDAAFSTWLSRIMINECLMQLRRERATREESWEARPIPEPVDDKIRAGLAELTLSEMKTLLENSINGLPRRYRSVYLLRDVQQLTTAETAAALGITPQNVKVLLHRAREKLKARLLENAAGAEIFPYHAPHCNRMTARVMAAVLAVA